jgi:hypothetical protein
MERLALTTYRYEDETRDQRDGGQASAPMRRTMGVVRQRQVLTGQSEPHGVADAELGAQLLTMWLRGDESQAASSR